jgi:hypothetical protein
VRIWDEAILPSALYTLGRYDITGMLKPFQRNGWRTIAEDLDNFSTALKAAADRDVVTIPEIVGPGLEEMRSWFPHDDDKTGNPAKRTVNGLTVFPCVDA